MKHINEQSSLQTTDLALAAALQAAGVKLVSVDKTNRRRAVFVYQNSHDVQQLINNFWSGDLLLDARTYFESIKKIKDRLYSE